MKRTSVHRCAVGLFLLVAIVVMAVGLQSPSQARAQATYTVTNLNNAGPGSLREAVALAEGDAAPDIINFAVSGVITLQLSGPTGRMDISTPITINGGGQITIDGGGVTQAFYINPGGFLTLNGITITNCFADYGFTWTGGAIHLDGGALVLNNSTISNSAANSEAGALYVAGIASATINNSTFFANVAQGVSAGGGNNGGAILSFGTLTISNSTFSGNSAPNGSGGAILNFDGTVTLTHVTVFGNSAGVIGGGIFNGGTGATYLAGMIVGGNAAASNANCYQGLFWAPVVGTSVADDVTCGFGAGNNATLDLGPLAANGGPTLTHLPGLASDALNLIPNGTTIVNNTVSYTCDQTGEPLDSDQRGSPRPVFASGDCDAGSVEAADLPAITINDVSQAEGDAGTTVFTFTLTRTGNLSGTSTVQVDTADDTATTAGGDYVALVGQVVTFAPTEATQTVGVTVNGDAIDEGASERFFVNLSNPTNALIDDPQGEGTIIDDDTAGITVAPIAGLVTTEAGGTDTFTVVLTSQPTADVTVGLSSSDLTEGTVAPAAVTFTAATWNVPQTVTVTGADDFVDDGDIAYTIVTAPAVSADPVYSGVNAADVAVTNTDDDTAGIVVAPIAGLVTTEAGGTATFTVVLTSEPTADVTVGLSSSDLTEGTVAPAAVTFTAATWNVPQTVTVTGVDDFVEDGDIAYTIVTAPAVSADPLYNALNADDVAVTNTDDDTVGIIVAPIAGLVTTEAGGTATFTVVLTSEPTADVTVGLSSSDLTEGTVAPAAVTFTAATWNVPQTVTVTGVDDFVEDGDNGYLIVTAPAVSADPLYNALNADDVAVTNTDDDTVGIIVAPIGGLVTTEAGGTATFTVVLTSEPLADVTVGLSSSDLTEGTVAPATVTFTAATWNVPQTVTVTGVDDFVDDGDIAYTIATAPAVSADPLYNALNADDVAVTNTDDDTVGIIVAPIAGLVTTEAGGTATFTVVLTSEPLADVTIGLSSSDLTEGTVAPAAVTFTAATWNVPQTVTVTGVDDLVDDGDIAYTIVTTAATSADPLYNALNADDVAVTNVDDDAAGIAVAPIAGLVTTEAGGTATFTVVLTSEPLADVTVGLSSSDLTEGTVAPAAVTFTAATWNVPQTVTVTGVDDFVDDGDIAYTIVTAPAVSADPLYNALNADDVAVTNLDDDTAGILVTPIAGLVTTEAGGTATFTVVLTSEPTADVTIGLTSSDLTEGTVAPAAVVFTPATWNVPQTVTVTGVEDLLVDGDIAYTIVTAPAASADLVYSGLDADDVAVTNLDNDSPPVAVDDFYTVFQAETLTVPAPGVLTNDTGGNGNPLQAVLDTAPVNGTLVYFNPDGAFQYVPDPGFVGTVTFTYYATDGTNSSVPATVTITVARRAAAASKTIANDDFADGPVGQVITVDVLANDVNLEGNPLSILAVTPPTSGSVAIVGGKLVFTPPAGYEGSVIMTYTAGDSFGNTDTATVTITLWRPVPLCADFDGSSNEIIRASVPAGTVTNGSVFCRVLVEDSQFVQPSAEIGQPGVLDRGVMQAVDVFALYHNGSPTAFFNNPIVTCLLGDGAFLYLDATVSPRAIVELPVFERAGYTCASIPNAGTVVLVQGAASVISPAPETAGRSVALSDCMVTTRNMLNLRTSPGLTGGIIRVIPYDVTLTAFERSGNWFYVDYLGQQGWVSGTYLTLQGACGQ